MNAGDKVYYLHTNQLGYETKFSAMIITFKSVVAADSIVPRNAPCCFEDDLKVRTTAQ
jgi:hypothetical protein